MADNVDKKVYAILESRGRHKSGRYREANFGLMMKDFSNDLVCLTVEWGCLMRQWFPTTGLQHRLAESLRQKFSRWLMLLLCKLCLQAQSCPTLCDPMSLPGSSVHGIFQAKILEWVAISFSRGSSQLRDWTHISGVSCIIRWILYHRATCYVLGWPKSSFGFSHDGIQKNQN